MPKNKATIDPLGSIPLTKKDESMTRPMYEALDAQGLPYLRPALTIGELPTPDERKAALVEATSGIAAKVGMQPVGVLKFALPVFSAFDMTRAKSKHYPDEKLLLTQGCDVSLDFCASFTES